MATMRRMFEEQQNDLANHMANHLSTILTPLLTNLVIDLTSRMRLPNQANVSHTGHTGATLQSMDVLAQLVSSSNPIRRLRLCKGVTV